MPVRKTAGGLYVYSLVEEWLRDEVEELRNPSIARFAGLEEYKVVWVSLTTYRALLKSVRSVPAAQFGCFRFDGSCLFCFDILVAPQKHRGRLFFRAEKI